MQIQVGDIFEDTRYTALRVITIVTEHKPAFLSIPDRYEAVEITLQTSNNALRSVIHTSIWPADYPHLTKLVAQPEVAFLESRGESWKDQADGTTHESV